MAKLDKADYKLREYPEKKSLLDQLMNDYQKTISNNLIRTQFDADELKLVKSVKEIKQMKGVPQTKIPFLFTIN
jgi:protease-4